MVAVSGPNPSTAHGVYNATPPTGADQQAMPLQTDINGGLKVALVFGGSAIDLTPPALIGPYFRTTKQLTPYILNQNTAATFQIAAAVAGQTTRLHRFWFITQGTTTITLLNGATPLAVWRLTGISSVPSDDLAGLLEALYITAINSALSLSSSVAVQIDGVFETITSA